MKFFTNMFEAWFKPKFISKCNSYITATLLRIEMIKRRRNAMQKYLRSDIVELIKIGLDSDAYGRVGRLYLDQLKSQSYDFVGQFCSLISNHVTTMNDQSECPEECKEAIPSLMYAAARFGDLPELRKLRSLFSEKYKNSLESFVNKEFIGLLKPERPSKDMKIQLMQEIAVEYGVEWDSNSFEQKLSKLPSSRNDFPEYVNGNQDKESQIPDHRNGWMISIQETTGDNNHHEKDDLKDDIEKQTENMRQRLLDFWSRTTSLLSTSRDTTTSSEETSSDDSTKSKSFFNILPMPYAKNNPNKNGTKSNTFSDSSTNEERDDSNKENEEVLNLPKGVQDDEVTSTNSRLKNMRRRKGRVRAAEGPKRRARAGSSESELTMSLPTRHVHPKLPSYDDIIARFAALREKS